LSEPGARFIGEDPQDIRRLIDNPGTPRKPNIILVTIESFSAKYMGSNGDERNLTPNLDALRKQSLYFNNFYATGTRTDRGLEAITLAIPPTPGRSIVKRIGRESGFASLGQQLKAVGYDSVFVYGGRGYFDNMNAFFSGNGYRIVTRAASMNRRSTSRTPGAWPTKISTDKRSSWRTRITQSNSRSCCN
jgi:phosphoglycerol transferase MdoB-like AlkP superfamily enzyme